MKRLIAILAICLLTVTAVFAQESDSSANTTAPAAESRSNFLFGFKAGIGLAKVRAVDTQGVYEDEYTAARVGWQIGARMGYFFSGTFGLMVDVEYIRKGFSQNYGGNELKINLDYVDVNLMFAVKFGGFYAGIGVYAGFKINSSYTLNDATYPTSDVFRDTDFGVVVTLGFMFGSSMNFFVGLDVKFGFTDIYKEAYATRWEDKNVGVYLNFGILFGM